MTSPVPASPVDEAIEIFASAIRRFQTDPVFHARVTLTMQLLEAATKARRTGTSMNAAIVATYVAELDPKTLKAPESEHGCTGFVPGTGFGNSRMCKMCRKPWSEHPVLVQ